MLVMKSASQLTFSNHSVGTYYPEELKIKMFQKDIQGLPLDKKYLSGKENDKKAISLTY